MFGFLRKLGLFRRRRRRLEVAALSAQGLVRAENQDHYLVNRGRAFFCVADGMGGGEGGAQASDIVCRCLGGAISHRVSFPERVKRAADAIRRANCEIREFARAMGYRQMATTVTLFAVDDGSASSAVIGYVGDSRVYRFRGGELAQLTHDHTLAGELSRRRLKRGLSAGTGGRAGVLSHVLTRAVGIEPEVQPDWRRVDLLEDDWYLLCSDGIYDMVPEDELRKAFAAGGTSSELISRIEEMTIAGGAVDNYTMIAVKVGGRR